MCEKIMSAFTDLFGMTPKEPSATAVAGGDAARDADAKVKLDDGATAYDRTSGGARVSGGGRKKAKTSAVPGLGL